jgi:hypothetical protein
MDEDDQVVVATITIRRILTDVEGEAGDIVSVELDADTHPMIEMLGMLELARESLIHWPGGDGA